MHKGRSGGWWRWGRQTRALHWAPIGRPDLDFIRIMSVMNARSRIVGSDAKRKASQADAFRRLTFRLSTRSTTALRRLAVFAGLLPRRPTGAKARAALGAA